MKNNLLKLVLSTLLVGTLVLSPSGAAVAHAFYEPCPIEDSGCDGGDTCTHRGINDYDAASDYGVGIRRNQNSTERGLYHSSVSRLGGILMTTDNKETVLVLLEGDSLVGYYKGQVAAQINVGNETAEEDEQVSRRMVSYSYMNQSGEEITVDLNTQAAGSTASIVSLASITIESNGTMIRLEGEQLAEFLAAINEAIAAE